MAKIAKQLPPGPGARAEVLLCSYGLYPEQITLETLAELKRCDRVLLDNHHPELAARVASWLAGRVDAFRRPERTHQAGLERIRTLVRLAAGHAARGERVAIMTYGNPVFISALAELAAAECARRKVSLRCLNAVSSIDALLIALDLRRLPGQGLRLVCACTAEGAADPARRRLLEPRDGNLVFNLHALSRPGPQRSAFIRELRSYPRGHALALVRCRSFGHDQTRHWLTAGRLPARLTKLASNDYTLYVPPLRP